MDKTEEPTDYSRPVAYDTDGQPLYAHPPINSGKPARRSTDVPNTASISDSVKIKHDRSQKIFPELNLSEDDYVISSLRRHPIGLLSPFALGIFLITLSFVALFNYDIVVNMFQLRGSMADSSAVFWPVIVFVILILLSEYIAYYVFISNRFFLTNENIVQQIQTGIFSNSEQIISLGNIEDASYSQNGILQQLFNFGIIRLSTKEDETIYKFTYVANPKECITTLDNAIENFKKFRRFPC